jgi:hypothetical protein
MMMTNVQNWVRSTRPHDRDMVYGDKLFYFEPYEEPGWLRDDGYRWYRISCSYWFADWIEANGIKNVQWEAYGERHRAIYLVRSDLFAFIKLKWL